jgi:hypothetical protein
VTSSAQFAKGTQRVLELLLDHRWHTSAEIEERCKVTAHSRLSDLRAGGCVIEKRSNRGATGREKFSYRLIATGEQMQDARSVSPLDEPEAGAAAASGSSSDDRSPDLHADLTANGEDPAGGETMAPPAGPAEPHELEDAGWRELYSEQLQIGAAP